MQSGSSLPRLTRACAAVYLDASDVAAAAGRHRYKPAEAVLAKVFRRSRPATAAAVDSELEGSVAALATAAAATADLRAAIDEDRPEKRARLVAEAAEAAAAARPEEAARLAPRLAAELTSAVNTARGVRDEAAAVTAVPGFVPGDGRIKYKLFQVGQRLFKFGARVDGRCAATGQLLEVKNRQRGLFDRIPQYELVQVLVYLYVFEEPVCHFRQKYLDELAPDQQVRRDDDWLRRLLDDGLEAFARQLDRMDADEAFRREVLREHPRGGRSA